MLPFESVHFFLHICKIAIIYANIMTYWNNKIKRLLKAELVKRGVSNADLAILLQQAGIDETKSGIDSKISRGTFSAAFFIQCLNVIGCTKIELESSTTALIIAAEPKEEYYTKK